MRRVNPETSNMTNANKSLGSIADELNVEYVKPKDLAGHCVNLIGARTRTGQFGEEALFEVQYIDGNERGCTAFVSLRLNPVREKLVEKVNEYGSIGPVMLAQVGEAKAGNERAWGFVDAIDATVAAAQEQMPF